MTASRESALEERVRDLDVRVGVTEAQLVSHGSLLEGLREQAARTGAVIDSLDRRIDGLTMLVGSSEQRVTAAVTETEQKLEGRLDQQDAAMHEVTRAARDAKDAATTAREIATGALVEARREWPTLAKFVATVLAGVVVGLIVWAITAHALSDSHPHLRHSATRVV